MTELEREVGRKARPFSLEFVLLPVRGNQVRPVGPDRFLVPNVLMTARGGRVCCAAC